MSTGWPTREDGRRSGVLERLVRRGPPGRTGERCELCAEAIGPDHGHVVDVRERRLLCACRPCGLLFVSRGAGNDQYRTVPDRYLDVGAALGPNDWDGLEIPVSVAFLLHSSALDAMVAFYPGPGGATESLLPLDTWDALVAGAPELARLEPDVEAVLVRSHPRGGTEAYVVPVDRCYELVGRLRSAWRGIDGGAEARAVVEEVFAQVAGRCGAGRTA